MEAASSWLRRALRKELNPLPPPSASSSGDEQDETFLLYGITQKLQEFVKGFTVDTFKNFTLPPSDEEYGSRSTSQNVRKDLTEWQERHATLVLSSVKEISQLRYVLCPRHMKERQFWRIYFALVKSYVAPYELWATQEAKLKKIETDDGKYVDLSAYEVEMVESKKSRKLSPSELGLSSSCLSNSECEGVAGDEAVRKDSSDAVLR